MRKAHAAIAAILLILGGVASSSSASARTAAPVALVAADLGAGAEEVDYQGVRAIKLTEPEDRYRLAFVPASLTGDGTIEVMVAGAPMAGVPEGVRGFFGVAFGAGDDPDHYEAVYLRATNGRTADPVRRTRALQYVSMPDHTWERLRAGHPGVYEKAADVGPSEWTRLRIELRGERVRVFVGAATAPALDVDRIRRPQSKGRIALWVGTATDAWFRDLKVLP